MKKIACLFFCLIIIFSCACGNEAEVPVVVVQAENEAASYTMVSVTRNDVVLTKNVKCTYVQTSDQEVSFNVTGKLVDKVYVKEGDSVKKGDLLCSLSSESIEKEIATLEYKVKRNELLLSYADNNEILDKQDVWLAKMYQGLSDEDCKKKIEDIEKSYQKLRVTYNDGLEFDREELAKKQKELKDSRLYATMDGIVYKITSKLEGSTSKADKVVMTIVDNTDCLFKTEVPEFADKFKDGEVVNMSIAYSSAAGDYELLPYDMENWDEAQLFSVFSGPETASIDVGTQGTIKLVLDTKTNVLMLPTGCVHEADGQAYVYVLNKDNMREVKWIETGLYGDDSVEIISGLEEGEKVVRK